MKKLEKQAEELKKILKLQKDYENNITEQIAEELYKYHIKNEKRKNLNEK